MNLKKSLLLTSFIFLCTLLASVSVNANTLSTSPDLKLGDQSPFVQELQKFLNLNGFTVNPTVGQPGSLGYETNLFGSLTKKALTSFQSAFNVPNTGYFGPKSKNAVAIVASKGRVLGAQTGDCPAGQIRSIEHYGITWTFQSCVPSGNYGTFVNGEPWVVGPVVVANINPNPSQSIDGVNHGSMKNPVPATNYGFDSRPNIYPLSYDPALNVALQLPITLNQRDVLVSVRSLLPNEDTKLKTVAALTVMEGIPPVGSFRPSIFGPTSERSLSTLKNISSVDWTVLKNYTKPASTPTKSEISALVPNLPWFEWSSSWDGHNLQARDNNADGKEYGRETAGKFGAVVLWLNTNQLFEDKKPIATQIIQNGLDIYKYVQYGGGFYHDGGHKAGRKLPVVVAAMMLNDSTLKTFVGNPDIFQEDTQTFFVTQADVDRVHDKPKRGGDDRWYYTWDFMEYRQEDIGTAEWGIRHRFEPKFDNRAWHTGYRDTVSSGMISAWLAAYIMNAQTVWNHPPAFEYMKKHYSVNGGWSSFFPSFTEAIFKMSDLAYLYGTKDYLPIVRIGTGGGEKIGNNNIYNVGETATVTAVPDPDSVFAGWTGCTSVSGNICYVYMNRRFDPWNVVKVEFNLSTQPPTTVTLATYTAGTGSGTISGNTSVYAPNSTVNLTAQPATGSTFGGWSGACTGTSLSCSFTITSNTSVTATFNGTGGGTDTGSWTKVANENQYFTVEASSTVRYGLNSSWFTKIVSGTNLCSNDLFGDPLYGFAKICEKSNTTTPPPASYSLSFNANGGSGTMSQQSFTQGETKALTLNTFTRTGYTFAGWSTTQTGTVSYTNGADYTMGTSNATLYAVWTAIPPTTYTLTASSTNGTITKKVNGVTTTATSFNSGTVVELTATPAVNYSFGSWNGCMSNTSVCNIIVDANKTVTASFSAITQPSTFKITDRVSVTSSSINVRSSSGISGTNLIGTQSFGALGTITSGPEYSTDAVGTIITWWNINYDSGVDGWSGEDNLKVETAVIPTTYSLSFNANGGSGTMSQQSFTQGETKALTLNTFTRTGYTFAGWSTTQTGTVSYTNGADYTMGTSNTSLYAVWTPIVVIPGDTDQDGILDTVDKCPNTPSTLKSVVNIYGCPKPKTLKLSIVSDVQNSDIKNIPTFTVKDLAGIYGKITYKENLNIFGTFPDTAQVDLDQYIQIVQGKVTVNSTLAPQFNKPANITLYNIKLTKPQLRVNGTMCGTCTNAVYNSTTKTYTFDVTGFSTYEVVEDPSINPNKDKDKDNSKASSWYTDQINAIAASLEAIKQMLWSLTN